ncbi:MAG: hypothetical protein ACTHON_15745 [Humibacter sp.]
MKTSNRIVTIAAAAVLAGTMLSGCSAAAGLSKAAGCLELAKAASTLSTTANDALSSATSDPAAAADKLAGGADKFDATVKKITDADVKAKAQAMSDAYKKFTTDFQAYAKDPSGSDPSALSSDATALSTAASDVSSVCNTK